MLNLNHMRLVCNRHTLDVSSIKTKYIHTSSMICSKVGKRRKDDRVKHAPHLEAIMKQATKKKGKDLCLDHFDLFYKKNFEKIWPSLRLALLSRPKFCALLNNYGDPETSINRLKHMGCYSIKKQYNDAFEQIQETVSDTQVKINQQEKTPKLDNVLPAAQNTDQPLTLTQEQAAERIILPQEMILQGGGSQIDAASASMYDFVPSTKIKGMEDFIEESDYYKYSEFKGHGGPKTSVPVEMREHNLITFPVHLEAYTFASGATDMRLEPPEKGILGTLDYYCMDAASLLPVLFLDVQKEHTVLDICAAPGGKSLAILQTMMPGRLVANDKDHSRMKRLMNMMSAYMQTYDQDFSKDLVEFKKSPAQSIAYHMPNTFDRVLCDVPCTTDRTSLHQNEGNIFNVNFKRTRLKIPEEQSYILQSAMRSVKPGGSVVYSTCTLSPVQNDGVVYDAIKNLWNDDGIEFIVEDLSKAIEPFRTILKFGLHRFGSQPYYGQLVLPCVENNFGPMYFAKLTRK